MHLPVTHMLAAISIVEKMGQGVEPVIGRVEKHPMNPLFGQDRPWEPRLDNGYPNVVHDPSDPRRPWRLWYGGCVGPREREVQRAVEELADLLEVGLLEAARRHRGRADAHAAGVERGGAPAVDD